MNSKIFFENVACFIGLLFLLSLIAVLTTDDPESLPIIITSVFLTWNMHVSRNNEP